MDLRKHLSFINPHSSDSKGRHHSSIREDEKPWNYHSRDSSKNSKSMVHNKSLEDNAADFSWLNHSKSQKSFEKERSPAPQQTRGYQMRRSDIGKENIGNNVPKSTRRVVVEKVDATDISNKYKNLFKSYEQLVKLNILNEEALKAEKTRSEDQKKYIGTLTAIIEESIAKGGLLPYLKKAFSQVNTNEDIYEYLFNVVDLHKRLQTANEIEVKLRNEIETGKKQFNEALKRKDRMGAEIAQFQKINEDLKLEINEKQKALEDYKKEKDEIVQEKRSLVEYIAILKENLVQKTERSHLQSESALKERYEQLRNEYKYLDNYNKELNNQKVSLAKELEEKNARLQDLEAERDRLSKQLKEKEDGLVQREKENSMKLKDYDALKSDIQNLKAGIEKEKETRQHLEVTLASRISEAARLQGQIDGLIKERDEYATELLNVEEKKKELDEENSSLRNEISEIRKNKESIERRSQSSAEENMKIMSEYLFEIKKEIIKTLQICNRDGGDKREKTPRLVNKELSRKEVEEGFREVLESLRVLTNRVEKLDEKYKLEHQKVDNEAERYRELELINGELEERLKAVEAGILKLNKQNQKLFKEKQLMGSELEQKEKELNEIQSKLDHEKENPKEANHDLAFSQLIIDYLQCFVFNPEVMETIELIIKNHQEIKQLENDHLEGSKTEFSTATSPGVDLQEKKEALIKRSQELEKDLYDLQIEEETRYHSLYQLEKQNNQLRSELNEFISTFGKEEERGLHSTDKKGSAFEETIEKERPAFSKLFADFRMPITQINFDTEE